MAYSRWGSSYWYTYWESTPTMFKLPTKKLKNKQIFRIHSGSNSLSVEYGDIKEYGIRRIISDLKEFHPSLPESDYIELESYIKQFINDINKHFIWSTFFYYEWYLNISKI
jgi:hypothetical protein